MRCVEVYFGFKCYNYFSVVVRIVFAYPIWQEKIPEFLSPCGSRSEAESSKNRSDEGVQLEEGRHHQPGIGIFLSGKLDI